MFVLLFEHIKISANYLILMHKDCLLIADRPSQIQLAKILHGVLELATGRRLGGDVETGWFSPPQSVIVIAFRLSSIVIRRCVPDFILY